MDTDAATVYMLRCRDGSYYVGITRRSLEERIGEHAAGVIAGYTQARRPVELVWHQHFGVIVDAIACERQLKGWSRAKKEALIAGDYARISALARRRSGASGPSVGNQACEGGEGGALVLRGSLARAPQDEGGGSDPAAPRSSV